jgi:hypothetical protein
LHRSSEECERPVSADYLFRNRYQATAEQNISSSRRQQQYRAAAGISQLFPTDKACPCIRHDFPVHDFPSLAGILYARERVVVGAIVLVAVLGDILRRRY